MNPLKEYPHLFANGKFKVEIHWSKGKKVIDAFIAERLPIANSYPADCTLIARPIEDMTDEEIRNIPRYITLNSVEEEKEEVCYKCKYGTLGYKDFIYLLSIGVYPFDQKAFQNGTVININKI